MLSRKISGRELIIIRGIPIFVDFVDIINEIEKSMKQKIHEIHFFLSHHENWNPRI